MKRDGRSGAEVSVKITCEEEESRWFETGAYSVMNIDLRDQEGK